MLEAIMREVDKDENGFLSLWECLPEADEEIEEKHKKLMETAFNTADSDKDGNISAAELPMGIKEFEKLSEVKVVNFLQWSEKPKVVG